MFPSQPANNCGTNCTGKCVLINRAGFHDSYECIATSTYYFCNETMSTYLIVISCFIGLNVIAFIGAYINGGHRTDWCTLIVSIVQNIVFITLIMGITCLATFTVNVGYIISIPVGISVGVIMNLITFCTLKAKRSRVRIFKDNGKTADIGSFDEYSAKAHFNPPIIKTSGVIIYNLPFVSKIKTIAVAFKEYIPYQSWRAESSPEPIELKGHSIVKVENDFIFSECIQSTIDDRKRNIAQTGNQSGAEIIGYTILNKVYKVKKEKLFGTSCFLSFYNSCFGKFIFVISHIFGLSAFMENIYGITTKIVHIQTKRTISGSNDLPTAALRPDSKAINGDICEQMPQSVTPQAQIFTGPNVTPMNQNHMQMNQMNQNQMQMGIAPMNQMNQNQMQMGMAPMNQNQMQTPYIGEKQVQPQIGMPNPDYIQNPYIDEP
jgi:hypothetical protein